MANDMGMGMCSTTVVSNPLLIAVGDYVVDTRVPLGSGFRCKVFVATHTKTGAKLAARMCTVPGAREYDYYKLRALTLGEIDIMQRLGTHPNIARLVDSVIEPTRVTTFLELSPHGDLLEWAIRNVGRRVSEAQTRRIFRQLLSALAFAHAENVAHGDIKLENVLLVTDDSVQAAVDTKTGLECVALRVQLIDWNLSSRAPHSLTSASGSPAYAAPELLVAYPDYNGFLSDVWALGIVTYSLLVGRQPFNTLLSTADETFDNIRTQDPLMPSYLSPAACVILTEMLCKNPDKRPTALQLQSHAWTMENAADPIYAHPPLLP